MTVTLLASAELGAVLPGPAALQASFALTMKRELAAAAKLIADLELDVPGLQADLDAAVNLNAQLKASLGIDPSATIAASLAYAADAQLALAAGLAGPSLSVELGAQLASGLEAATDLSAKIGVKLAAIAEIKVRIAAMNAALDLALSFGKLLAAGGVRLLLYTGPLEHLGAELSAFLDVDARGLGGAVGIGASVPVYVPILVTDSSVSFEAMKGVFQLS
jgi:hypothetical protein